MGSGLSGCMLRSKKSEIKILNFLFKIISTADISKMAGDIDSEPINGTMSYHTAQNPLSTILCQPTILKSSGKYYKVNIPVGN